MPKYNCPEYEQLKKNLMRGWKTWNVNSVFSFVHMPDGLSVNLSMKEYRNGCFLQDALIGRFPADDWRVSGTKKTASTTTKGQTPAPVPGESPQRTSTHSSPTRSQKRGWNGS